MTHIQPHNFSKFFNPLLEAHIMSMLDLQALATLNF